MALSKYFDRIIYLDSLIRTRSTGTISDLSIKLGLSKRMTYEYLNIMKEYGAPIIWSYSANSYIYTSNVKFKIGFFRED